MSDWRNDPATDRQREYAASLNVAIPDGATKGEASDLISAASETSVERTITVNVSLNPTPKKRGFFSRLFGARSGAKSVPRREPDPIHAKPGTFDESEFIHPETGRFQFPKYKHDKSYLVKIKDMTSYREDMWFDMTAAEKREFTLRDFEFSYCGCDIEVEDFEDFFGKPGNHYLGDLVRLRNQMDTVIELLDAGREGEVVDLSGKIEQDLVKGGYVFQQDIVSLDDKRESFGLLTVAGLKNLARDKGLKLGGKKDELIQRLMDSGYEFDLPKLYTPAPSFYEWIEQVGEGYVAEVRRNAARFHPLYHEEIWDLADGAGFDEVEAKIEAVRSSRYWRDLMTL